MFFLSSLSAEENKTLPLLLTFRFERKPKDLFIFTTHEKKSKARRDKEDRAQEFSKTIKSLKRRHDDESMAV